MGTYGKYPPTKGAYPTSTTNRPSSINNRPSIINDYPGGLNFNSFFRSMGLSPLQVVQSDLGGTYGGTLLDAGGLGPVVTISGTLLGPFVPLLLKCTLGGALGVWTWSLYSDGGTTPFQTGTSAAGPTALSGAASGLSMSIGAGTAVLNNTWSAVISAWADQSGNGYDWTQSTPGKQFVVTPGLNGKPGFLSDGSNDFMASALNLPAPGTTPAWHGLVFRVVTWKTNGVVVSGVSGGSQLLYTSGVTPNLKAFNGTNSAAQNVTLNNWECTDAGFTGSTSDFLRRGSNAKVSGVNFANAASVSRVMGGLAASNFGNVEFLHQVTLGVIPSDAQINQWRAAVTGFYGASVAV